jgi:PKHD-type hydroxylase
MSHHALPYVALPNAFTAAELDEIVRLGDALTAAKATIAERPADDHYADIRVTETAWMVQDQARSWLYEKITALVQAFNDNFYRFELTGFSDPFQYTVYHAGPDEHHRGHYDWHADHGRPDVARKLSLSLQLSDPAAYEGCDLEMHVSTDISTAPRERGTLIAFPSCVLHRVTPITAGTRKALVIWAAGPPFR